MLKLILDPVKAKLLFLSGEGKKKKDNPETQIYLTKNKNYEI